MSLNLAGLRVGRWTVKYFSGERLRKQRLWFCVCDCGSVGLVIASNLKRGVSRSCGCLQKDIVTKHGHSAHGKSLEYQSWTSMIDRCTNKKSAQYRYYGGRGIAICDGWRSSFELFLKEMGPRPSKKYSLDRVDNNGNYEPSNCRWATTKQQSNNKRSAPNKTGFAGVKHQPNCSKNPFTARITVNGKCISLGYFPTADSAHEAYVVAKQKQLGEVA